MLIYNNLLDNFQNCRCCLFNHYYYNIDVERVQISIKVLLLLFCINKAVRNTQLTDAIDWIPAQISFILITTFMFLVFRLFSKYFVYSESISCILKIFRLFSNNFITTKLQKFHIKSHCLGKLTHFGEIQ
jgi:hypothetical protein